MADKRKSRRILPHHGEIDPVDLHVVNQMKARRQQLGISQRQMAALMDVSPQMYLSYEQLRSRMAASVLWKAARSLRCDPGYFFQDLPGRKNIYLADIKRPETAQVETTSELNFLREWRQMPRIDQDLIRAVIRRLIRKGRPRGAPVAKKKAEPELVDEDGDADEAEG